MRILVCTKNAWNDMNAVGNTISNFFGSQENMVFSNLYSRSEMPANRICTDYYRITETQMLKNIFQPEKIGYHFTISEDEMDFSTSSQKNNERKMINFVKSHSLKSFYRLSDILWNKCKWNNKKLENYILSFNPDIVFSFATEPIILKKRIELIRNLCNSKIFLFVADDVYSVYLKNNNKKIINDFKWCIENADYLYGASEELCKEYERIFGRKFHFLCKGCNVFDVKNDKSLSPIKLVYAGNLFYGRDKVLANLINSIKEINEKSSIKFFLEIYTTSPINEEINKMLNVEDAGAIIGARSYDEILRIMNKANISLQIESFEQEQIDKVRLSFSTKICDCIQSGSAVMAIGPNGISSIEYLKKVDGAIVVTKLEEIKTILAEIAADPHMLYECALKTNDFAKINHDIVSVRKKINDDFKKLLKES